MSGTTGGGDWFSIETLWDVVKYALSAAFAVASSILLWLANHWRTDRSMLLRHEERLNDNDRELGEARAFRAKVDSGHVGIKLNGEIDELKEEDRRLHKRIARSRKVEMQILTRFQAMETNIDWIRRELQRKKDQE